MEGQLLFEKNNHRKDNADRLCKYGCKCCARCVHVQAGNQNEVADDVDDTCDEDEQERRFAVAKSAENRRQKVVGDDEENTATADTNITCGQSDCFTNNDDPPVNTVDGRKPGVYTLLVAGVDVVSNNTDTIMIGRLDTVNHTLNVVSIPRDTLTNIQHEVKKANSAYHYAAYYSGIQSSSYYGCDPIKKMREELIKSFLGFDVDGYILVNMDAAEQVVDAIGGVDFNVPPGMDYDDPTQDLHIHIPEGQQKLNGEQFVQLMRFRSGYAGGDIQRIDMQHELLMAVASQMISLKNIPNLTEVISIVSDNMETSLTAENMLYYAKEFLKLDSENIKFYTMPGDTGGNVFGASYVFCDIDAWLDMVNECLNPWEAKVTTKNVNIVTYKDGNFYSTTGELSGGVSSFLNYSSSSTMGMANVYTYTSSPSTTNSGSKDDNE